MYRFLLIGLLFVSSYANVEWSTYKFKNPGLPSNAYTYQFTDNGTI